METLARLIEREMHGAWKHCAIYEEELQLLWPLEEQDREAKIVEFVKTYGLRLRFYHRGLCAIFDKGPGGEFAESNDARSGHIKLRDLEPVKDVTGGGGSKSKSKRNTGRKG